MWLGTIHAALTFDNWRCRSVTLPCECPLPSERQSKAGAPIFLSRVRVLDRPPTIENSDNQSAELHLLARASCISTRRAISSSRNLTAERAQSRSDTSARKVWSRQNASDSLAMTSSSSILDMTRLRGINPPTRQGEAALESAIRPAGTTFCGPYALKGDDRQNNL